MNDFIKDVIKYYNISIYDLLKGYTHTDNIDISLLSAYETKMFYERILNVFDKDLLEYVCRDTEIRDNVFFIKEHFDIVENASIDFYTAFDIFKFFFSLEQEKFDFKDYLNILGYVELYLFNKDSQNQENLFEFIKQMVDITGKKFPINNSSLLKDFLPEDIIFLTSRTPNWDDTLISRIVKDKIEPRNLGQQLLKWLFVNNKDFTPIEVQALKSYFIQSSKENPNSILAGFIIDASSTTDINVIKGRMFHIVLPDRMRDIAGAVGMKKYADAYSYFRDLIKILNVYIQDDKTKRKIEHSLTKMESYKLFVNAPGLIAPISDWPEMYRMFVGSYHIPVTMMKVAQYLDGVLNNNDTFSEQINTILKKIIINGGNSDEQFVVLADRLFGLVKSKRLGLTNYRMSIEYLMNGYHKKPLGLVPLIKDEELALSLS